MKPLDTIAEWMLAQLNKNLELCQEEAFYWISTNFGDKYAREENGSQRIDKDVLEAFKTLTGNTVVREGQCWRFRQGFDPIGERQA